MYACNLAERASIEAAAARTLQEHGAVDILINNAGIVDGKRLLEATDAEIERTFAVNTLALFRTVRAFLPGMLAQGAGHIVTIASASGIAAVPRLADYSASKAAAIAFDESLRLELKHDGAPVRTTVVCPFYIRTGMFEGVRTRFPLLLPIMQAGGRRRAHRARHRARRGAADPAVVRAHGLPAAPAAGGLVRCADGFFRHHQEHGCVRRAECARPEKGKNMTIVANIAVALVALLHLNFLVLEMFFWDKPLGRRIFGLTPEFAKASKSLAANQGLYNGFLVAGLVWGIWLGAAGGPVKVFFLGCVIVAGVFGALTVSRKILWVQALPGAIALGAGAGGVERAGFVRLCGNDGVSSAPAGGTGSTRACRSPRCGRFPPACKLVVEVVAELVQQGAQEAAEGHHALVLRRAHPQLDDAVLPSSSGR